jgi:hypothetical protein
VTHRNSYGTWDDSNEAIMNTIDELKQKLPELEKEIQKTKKQLPAHSVKPQVMMDLLELEDRYVEIMKQIERLKKRETENGKLSQ